MNGMLYSYTTKPVRPIQVILKMNDTGLAITACAK